MFPMWTGRAPRLASCFLFSSRRRHTRLTCDWSSDACSSDLFTHFWAKGSTEELARGFQAALDAQAQARSEERRVGKECRSRGSPHHQKKRDSETDILVTLDMSALYTQIDRMVGKTR